MVYKYIVYKGGKSKVFKDLETKLLDVKGVVSSGYVTLDKKGVPVIVFEKKGEKK